MESYPATIQKSKSCWSWGIAARPLNSSAPFRKAWETEQGRNAVLRSKVCKTMWTFGPVFKMCKYLGLVTKGADKYDYEKPLRGGQGNLKENTLALFIRMIWYYVVEVIMVFHPHMNTLLEYAEHNQPYRLFLDPAHNWSAPKWGIGGWADVMGKLFYWCWSHVSICFKFLWRGMSQLGNCIVRSISQEAFFCKTDFNWKQSKLFYIHFRDKMHPWGKCLLHFASNLLLFAWTLGNHSVGLLNEMNNGVSWVLIADNGYLCLAGYSRKAFMDLLPPSLKEREKAACAIERYVHCGAERAIDWKVRVHPDRLQITVFNWGGFKCF